MEDDWKETANVASQHPEVLKQLVAEHKKWDVSCRSSFEGQDYALPFDPGFEYRGEGGLALRKGKKKKAGKSGKKEKS